MFSECQAKNEDHVAADRARAVGKCIAGFKAS